MRKTGSHTLPELFSPLDLATILYMACTAAYMCFGPADMTLLLPHFAVRIIVLIVACSLAMLNTKYEGNRFILFLRNLYPLLFLGFFYTETSCMKNIIFHNNLDYYFYNAEQNLWHCQPSAVFSKIMNQDWFNELMNICYFSYYIIIGLVCVALYFSSSKKAQKGIFIVIVSFYMYYLIFAILPVVGPQYYVPDAISTIPPHFFGKLMHNIIISYEQPTGAFPSSHVGVAFIISYISYNYIKKLFFITLPFVIGICFATVYIKAHYLVDVVAGIISAPIFIHLSKKIYDKFTTLSSIDDNKMTIPGKIDL